MNIQRICYTSDSGYSGKTRSGQQRTSPSRHRLRGWRRTSTRSRCKETAPRGKRRMFSYSFRSVLLSAKYQIYSANEIVLNTLVKMKNDFIVKLRVKIET